MAAAHTRALALLACALGTVLILMGLPGTAVAPVDRHALEAALLALGNADRARYGLAPLVADTDTLTIARQRAASQLATASLSHYGPNGELLFTGLLYAADLQAPLNGENLARGSADAGLVEAALMQSPRHRANILEPSFRTVAWGVAMGTAGVAYAAIYRS